MSRACSADLRHFTSQGKHKACTPQHTRERVQRTACATQYMRDGDQQKACTAQYTWEGDQRTACMSPGFGNSMRRLPSRMLHCIIDAQTQIVINQHTHVDIMSMSHQRHQEPKDGPRKRDRVASEVSRTEGWSAKKGIMSHPKHLEPKDGRRKKGPCRI